MRGRVVIWVIAVLFAVIGFMTVPGMVESSIPSIYYVTPMVKTYENVINCSGVVESENVYQVYAPSGFVAEEVCVSLGDMVEAGQILAVVNQEATQRLPQGIAESVPEEIASGIEGFKDIDVSSILSAYGLMGILNGGLNLNDIADSASERVNAIQVTVDASLGDITAPADGIITAVNISQGGAVVQGRQLFTLHDIKNYLVLVSVGEADIEKIQLGDRAVIRGVGFAGASFMGEVTKIHPTAHRVLTGTSADTVVDVEIKVQNPNSRLKPGFTAKVEIAGGNSYQLITVPYEAIRQDENNEEFVYLYENGKLRKAPVVTGRELVSEVEVLEGIEPDSIVIFNPDDVPGEGAIVNIKGRAQVA